MELLTYICGNVAIKKNIMKTIKLLSLLLAIGLFSCNKEDVQPQEEEQVDCNCDRVVSVNSFNLTTGPFYNYITINDCTEIQNEGTVYYPIAVGDCL